ncbi:PilW family protein [Neisseria sp. 23W00296]|uniref:PilW family protein n=1 Tax=unclassified Neisseria TaxID=2623750 RepID=UPI0002A4309A|nr:MULTISPECIES: prepilin-type N-terminal cleavage/methylation domain-containing protein [unclassified Neisseria]ASP18110.1 prepilin-type N [Neisseria sp. KEM232]EKY06754.1 prepilin-type cleavage/methylation protein [Neisseria sp. oral taxon 020 str. F0370]
MMSNKNIKISMLSNNYRRQLSVSGFTLIELLVAAALSMIVLVAAGSGFIATQKLSTAANARLQVQQDLRNATNMIVRDARMAGFFGCFNLSKQSVDGGIVLNDYGVYKNNNYTNHNRLDDLLYKNEQNQGIKLIPVADARGWLNSNFSFLGNNVLLFTYGIGSGNAKVSGNFFNINIPQTDELAELSGHDAAPVVVSSCSTLERFSGAKKVYARQQLRVAQVPVPLVDVNNATIFRQSVNVYAIGQPNGGDKGLYLFQMNADGTFGEPQLLLTGVDSWDIQFGYYASSPACTEKNNDAKIKFQKTILTGAKAPPPTLLRLKLQGRGGDGNLVAGKSSNGSASDIQTYHIDATVHAGAFCADRGFQQEVKFIR